MAYGRGFARSAFAARETAARQWSIGRGRPSPEAGARPGRAHGRLRTATAGFVALALSGGLWILPAAPAVADTGRAPTRGPAPLDNSWFNPANWSAAGVPDSSQDVCIGDITVGTYTVAGRRHARKRQRSVRSRSVAPAALRRSRSTARRSRSAADSSVSTHGAITLEGSGPAVVNLAGPTLANAGTLSVRRAGPVRSATGR